MLFFLILVNLLLAFHVRIYTCNIGQGLLISMQTDHLCIILQGCAIKTELVVSIHLKYFFIVSDLTDMHNCGKSKMNIGWGH